MNFFKNFVGKFWLILHYWKCISRRKIHFASNRFRILTALKNVAAAVTLPDVCLPKQNCQFHSSKKNLVKIMQTGYKSKKSKRSLDKQGLFYLRTGIVSFCFSKYPNILTAACWKHCLCNPKNQA